MKSARTEQLCSAAATEEKKIKTQSFGHNSCYMLHSLFFGTLQNKTEARKKIYLRSLAWRCRQCAWRVCVCERRIFMSYRSIINDWIYYIPFGLIIFCIRVHILLKAKIFASIDWRARSTGWLTVAGPVRDAI